MNKVRSLFKKALTPVTIMVIPHDTLRSLNFKIPAIKIFWTISRLVDRIFYESLTRARKERQIAPQASAGYCFS